MQKPETTDSFARRTAARELFMQLLFQMEVQGDYSERIKENFMKASNIGSNQAGFMKAGDMNPGQAEYFERLFSAVTENLPAIDDKLEAYSENWRISRMAKVDLAILRLSAAELLYLPDVPDSASINEAVEMAKKFGGEDSSKFVNGILGKVVRNKDAN